jgi:hypothetical protein
MTGTIEIAYHVPGWGWQWRTFRSLPAAIRWIDRLDDDVEVRWAA